MLWNIYHHHCLCTHKEQQAAIVQFAFHRKNGSARFEGIELFDGCVQRLQFVNFSRG